MDLMSLTAVELGKKIQAKEVTVEEAVKAAIASIKAKEEKINSFVTIDEEGALKKAAEVQAKIDAGELKGALAGVPVAIKDNMCTEGLLTTCSSKILYNFIPTYTAEAVKRLEDAGCVIVGRQQEPLFWEKPTWMSLPWEAPQRHLPLEQPKTHGIQSTYRAVHQAEAVQQLQQRRYRLHSVQIQADQSDSQAPSVV